MTYNISSEQQGKRTTASAAPLMCDLEARIIALEADVAQLKEDVRKYTEHCIRLMQASTQLAILMQEYGIDTRSAAAILNKPSAH